MRETMLGGGRWRWTSLMGSALALGIAVAALASGSSASSVASVLTGGQTLGANQSLQSADGHYELTMQSDGNLVETITGGGRVIWSSGTSGSGNRALLQDNAELVVQSSTGDTLWSDNQPATGGCPVLNVLDDGNLEVDGPTGLVWASGENDAMRDGDELLPGQTLYASNYEFYFTMQTDGNLVLYNSSAKALWASKTNKHPGAYAILQSDGNLVVYPPSGAALWSSGTHGDGGDYLDVQTDGNVVLYSSAGKAVWKTGTSGAAAGSGSIQPKPQLGTGAACPGSATTTASTPTITTVTAPATTATNTVTVTVPTTTVVTVIASPTATKLPKVRFQVLYHWHWNGNYSYVNPITFGRVPPGLHWEASVTPLRRGAKARTARATSARQRHELLRWLERQRYYEGQRVTVVLSRSGYAPETATFVVRYHHVPFFIGPTAK